LWTLFWNLSSGFSVLLITLAAVVWCFLLIRTWMDIKGKWSEHPGIEFCKMQNCGRYASPEPEASMPNCRWMLWGSQAYETFKCGWHVHFTEWIYPTQILGTSARKGWIKFSRTEWNRMKWHCSHFNRSVRTTGNSFHYYTSEVRRTINQSLPHQFWSQTQKLDWFQW
jgi:hypothetical protein